MKMSGFLRHVDAMLTGFLAISDADHKINRATIHRLIENF